MQTQPELNARAMARRGLNGVAKRLQETVPPFSTWMLGGFGAAMTLMVVNVEKVSQVIDARSIRLALILFACAAGAAVLAQYLSIMVRASLAGDEDALEMQRAIIGDPAAGIDVPLFITEYKRGLFPWIRALVTWQQKRLKPGDLGSAARMAARLAQLMSTVVLVQALLSLSAIAALAMGIK